MKQHRSSRNRGLPKRHLERNVSEAEIKDHIDKRGKQKNIKEYLIDYTANTNLHGLRYIGEKKNTPAEKVFWLLIFLLCVIYCAILIQQVWIKWVESPVMVSFAEKLTPAWQIPYPAVTICFSTKALPIKFNYTEYYYLYTHSATRANLTEEEKRILEDFLMICDYSWDPPGSSKFTDGNLTVTNIKNLSAKFTIDTAECEWGIYGNCQDFFSPIITEEGLCQTFNTLRPEQLFRLENLHSEYEYMPMESSNSQLSSWTLDGGYPPATPLDTYPYRGSGNGGKDNLLIQISTDGYNLDYVCTHVQGYQIFLHNPAELPRFSRHYIKLPLSQEVRIAVKPKMMTTTEGLKSYSPLRRQCYFTEDRYLRYFKIYTQANCDMECLANFTHARCGCVHFGLPHGSEMKTCGPGSMDCMTKSRSELVQLEIEFGMDVRTSDNDTLGRARAVAAKCRCLPACNTIEYEAETSQAEVDVKALNRAYRMPDSDESFLSATIYLKEPQFTTVLRSELYGRVDFLANCGGLLGLFMGFSVLSVVEIIYFLTLRWWCLITKNRRIHKDT